jgi:hypothetical protein
MTKRVQVITATTLARDPMNDGTPFAVEQFDKKLLAQGDSWFSIGTLVPWATTSILLELQSLGLNNYSAVIVNTASTGKTLKQMSELLHEPQFAGLLCGNQECVFDGILISGFGNDLINATNNMLSIPKSSRLFLTKDEAANSSNALSYMNEEGWKKFKDELVRSINELIALRGSSKHNKQTPIFIHNYCKFMPRNSGVAGLGPWLYKGMNDCGVPSLLHFELSVEIFKRITDILNNVIVVNNSSNNGKIHLVDTLMQSKVIPGEQHSTGVSNDSQNEIHLTSTGYNKVAKVWQSILDTYL